MAAGISDRLLSMDDIVALLGAPAPAKSRPYKSVPNLLSYAMARTETELEIVERPICQGEAHITRQLNLIVRRREDGHDTTESERLLVIFGETARNPQGASGAVAY